MVEFSSMRKSRVKKRYADASALSKKLTQELGVAYVTILDARTVLLGTKAYANARVQMIIGLALIVVHAKSTASMERISILRHVLAWMVRP